MSKAIRLGSRITRHRVQGFVLGSDSNGNGHHREAKGIRELVVVLGADGLNSKDMN
jgi:hypothetical protein